MERERIGFTTTIPVEIILAAGDVPIDLNNIFVSSAYAGDFIRRAEMDGYPRNLCSWIKGIYGSVMMTAPVDRIIIVTEGDCSNTISMLETFQVMAGAPPIITFNFPHNRDAARLEVEMRRLSSALGTTLEAAEEKRRALLPLRDKLRRLDDLTWKTGQVTGGENHLYLISSSDFGGDPEVFERRLDVFLEEAEKRPSGRPKIRLAFAGVPPIFSNLYQYLSDHGAEIILNEMQRQFSMPYDCESLVEQYLLYTYPYDIFFRLKDLAVEIKRRRAHGLIHYVQAFCHRGIEDIVLRHELDIPILTLEGDAPGQIDARTRLRLETFLELIQSKVQNG